MSNIERFLDRPVRDLVAEPLPAQQIKPETAERHQIYSLLLMAIARCYWNGNKCGRRGTYLLNPSEAAGDIGDYLDKDYRGHNICALSVDADGYVIDFDFNHNEIFNSSAEHAEARLIRRIFSLVQVEDSWNLNKSNDPERRGNLLPDVTFYTTLESCSQCSGIMALATVKEIVYLQRDPGMYSIGNIMWRMTESTDLPAPLPISGEQIGLPYFKELNDRYLQFERQQAAATGKPFFMAANGHDKFSPSLTSFLCTKAAFEVFQQGEKQFEAWSAATLKFPNHKPPGSKLANAECLAEATDFWDYARKKAHRGTPHK